MDRIEIKDLSDIDALRQRAIQDQNDDLLGVAESLTFGIQEGILVLPLGVTMPDPPDGLIFSSDKPILAIEVRRVTWKRLKHVEAHARPWAIGADGEFIPGDLVEQNAELLSDESARRDGPKGSRTGDFRAIKAPGEKLDGPGMLGGELESSTLRALQNAVEEKQAKFDHYSEQTNRVWLSLIPDFGAWDEILSDPALTARAREICETSDFERVLLLRFLGRMTALR